MKPGKDTHCLQIGAHWVLKTWERVVLVVLMMLAFFNPFAHAAQQDMQFWAPITLELPVTHKLKFSMEGQPRLVDNMREISLIRVRPSVSYNLRPNWTVTAGYLWSPLFPLDSQPEDTPTRYEQRIWQQSVVSHPLSQKWGTKMAHRVRLEERFLHNANNVGWRFRYQNMIQQPIGKSQWSLVLSDEIQYNLNDAGPAIPSGLNGNRLFTGVRREFGRSMQVEGGYMLVWQEGFRQNPTQLNHVILLRANITAPTLIKSEQPTDPHTPYVAPDQMYIPY